MRSGQPTEGGQGAPGRDSRLQQPLERRAPDHCVRPFAAGLPLIQGNHPGLGASSDRLLPDLLQRPQLTAAGGGIKEIRSHLNQLAPAIGKASVEIHLEAMGGAEKPHLSGPSQQLQQHHRYERMAEVAAPFQLIEGQETRVDWLNPAGQGHVAA